MSAGGLLPGLSGLPYPTIGGGRGMVTGMGTPNPARTGGCGENWGTGFFRFLGIGGLGLG